MKDLLKKIIVSVITFMLVVCCIACGSSDVTDGDKGNDGSEDKPGIVNPDGDKDAGNDDIEENTSFTITYDPIVSNAVITGSGDALKSGYKQTVEYDKPYTLYQPQSAHNVFIRWYYVKDGVKVTLAAEGVYTLKEDITVYAEWYDASSDDNIVFPE